ncbi:hypothetical protein NM688_g5748 [Phlebia brevispora]|uniref:Uncharacterized protein n=1 Tax=Phlebia brevispora TaxID=194682 RepID=A0ACC1SQR1_9APHY|nr:hypothetical protein NM688_g5748 [Phlebia brevispora]
MGPRIQRSASPAPHSLSDIAPLNVRKPSNARDTPFLNTNGSQLNGSSSSLSSQLRGTHARSSNCPNSSSRRAKAPSRDLMQVVLTTPTDPTLRI